ncbi:signal peptide peptidase SppA [Bosea sp. (in: a-proteobacteria)]|uniref:signal peptide peptidase SppA n=1 Tax=Bosea sp. (in: a-proteobacteria) TaxID=1871050 RepID=UPI00262CFA41|nr:signal peptide peptidase SppA [Bosea sp. (in: a-proteobacteria)]MCO5091600.1 signal peptide peptidase SppA [Bosea sp. (in: a-proteobacteria)]
MPPDADLLADRRSLRRKLTRWRVLAVVGVITAAVIGGLAWKGEGPTSLRGAHVARLTVSGFISGDRRTLDLIKSVEDSNAVSAVVLRVDSPGGTTAGAEALHTALRRLAAKKPMVAVVDGVAASGGYIAAMGADRIVARQTSLVGSIGVLFQFPNVSNLLDTVGVKVEAIKSSPLKAAPNGFEPTSPEARAAIQRVVDDNYAWFRDMVRERRHLAEGEVASVSDGRVHSGRQALGLKLVDQIGGEPEAIAWMEQEKNLAKDLRVRDWRRRSESSAFGLWSLAEAMARGAGLDALAATIARAADQPVGLRLDAPLALWQPAAEK